MAKALRLREGRCCLLLRMRLLTSHEICMSRFVV